MVPRSPLRHSYRLGPSRFLRDLIFTTATSLATGVTLILLTRLAADRLGPVGFGLYSVARRFVATAVPVLTLSMGVAIARYAALVREPLARRNVLRSGLVLALLPTLVVGALMLAARDLVGEAVFGGHVPPGLVESMLLFLPGMAAFGALFAWYRGTGQMGRANLWQITVIGVGPLVLAWRFAPGANVAHFLLWLALPALAAVIPLVVTALRRPAGEVRPGPLPDGSLRELAGYGVPRVPAGLALASLLGAGVFLAPHLTTLQDAGYLAMGQAVFALADTGLAGFGLLVLPRAAQFLAEGQSELLRRATTSITALSIHFGLFACLQLLVWADTIVLAWLGPAYAPAVPLIRVQLCVLAPYLFYTLLRSVVDALDTRAINTYNLLVALAVTMITCAAGVLLGWGALGLAMGTAVGLLTLGLATVGYLWRGGWIVPGQIGLRLALALNLALVAVSALVRLGLPRHGSVLTSVLVLGVLELVLVALYWVALRRFQPALVGELEQRLLRKVTA